MKKANGRSHPRSFSKTTALVFSLFSLFLTLFLFLLLLCGCIVLGCVAVCWRGDERSVCGVCCGVLCAVCVEAFWISPWGVFSVHHTTTTNTSHHHDHNTTSAERKRKREIEGETGGEREERAGKRREKLREKERVFTCIRGSLMVNTFCVERMVFAECLG